MRKRNLHRKCFFLRRRGDPEGGAWLRRGAQAQPSVGRVFGRLRGEAGGSAAPRVGVGVCGCSFAALGNP